MMAGIDVVSDESAPGGAKRMPDPGKEAAHAFLARKVGVDETGEEFEWAISKGCTSSLLSERHPIFVHS